MSTTTSDNTPADRGRPIKPDKFGERGATDAWRRWCAMLREARAFVTIALAVLAVTACDGAAGTPTAGSPANSCHAEVSVAWASSSGFASLACPGSVSITWSITNGAGQPSSCFQTRATSVALRLQSRTGGTPVFTAFPCNDSRGTANVPPGLYDVAIELHDGNGAKLAIAPPQASVAVAVGRTTTLTPAAFVVNAGGGGGGAAGHLALTLQTAGFATNCLSTGGAGITGSLITIITEGGSCAAVKLIRNRGGVEVGTYQVDCDSPSVTTCIEADESLTAPDLAPGNYTIHVGGAVGGGACFAADGALAVPQTGQLKKVIVMQHQNVPGC
ncbi:MAG: hypothetical protein ABIY55_20400 [Kofleriaceae bacterium]